MQRTGESGHCLCKEALSHGGYYSQLFVASITHRGQHNVLHNPVSDLALGLAFPASSVALSRSVIKISQQPQLSPPRVWIMVCTLITAATKWFKFEAGIYSQTRSQDTVSLPCKYLFTSCRLPPNHHMQWLCAQLFEQHSMT